MPPRFIKRLAFLLILCGLAPAARPQDRVDLPSVFEGLSRPLRALHSVDCRYTTETHLSPGLAAKYHLAKPNLVTRTTYAEQGSSFRDDGETVDGNGSTTATSLLFDGRKHQSYIPGAGLLMTSSRVLGDESTPNSATNPLMVPFEFAMDPGEVRRTKLLRDPVFWNRVRPGFRWVGESQAGGRPAVILERSLRLGGREVVRRVWLARDLGWYPLRWEQYDARGKLLNMTQVEERREWQTEDGLLVVPMRTRSELYDDGGTCQQMTEVTIDPASLRVNESIPEERFTISPSQVREFVDADTGKRVLNRDPAGAEALAAAVHQSWEAPGEAAGRRWRWLRWGAGAAAALAASVWWVARRRRAA